MTLSKLQTKYDEKPYDSRATDELLELWPLTPEEATDFMQFYVNCGACGLAWVKQGEKFVWRGSKCPNCGQKDGNVRWVSSIVQEEWEALK